MIQINDKTKCCGCTACMSACPKNCISMEEDYEGFLYPKVDIEKCINCHACERVCRYLINILQEESVGTFGAIQYVDDCKRMESTAGGAFSLIADFLIKEGAIVFAVSYDENLKVCHKSVSNMDQLSEFRGSKYVQSDLHNTFQEIKILLKNRKMVLFVGTPCQVYGLKKYVGDSEFLYCIDLLCLGVSSPGLFKKYIKYLQEKYQKKVKKVEFRNKKFGYSTPNVRVVFDDEKYLEQTYDSKVHANLFFKKYYNVRPSCYECGFREIPRVSDFTIGDFNDIGVYSKTMDDDLGTTRIWTHTIKGKELMKKLDKDSRYLLIEDNCNNIIGGPKKQIKKPEDRDDFYCDATNMTYASFVKKWEPKDIKGELVSKARILINYLPFRKFVFSYAKKIRMKKFRKREKLINSK